MILVNIHDIPKETCLLDFKTQSHQWILTLILKYLTVTVTRFTQYGPVEDHNIWHNKVPKFYNIFNLNQNSTYEAAPLQIVSSKAIQSVLVNTFILVFTCKILTTSSSIIPHSKTMHAAIWLSLFRLLKFTTS